MTPTNDQFLQADIQLAFNKAAKSYDKVAVLQKTVMNGLLERCSYISLKPNNILDLGSGTGHASRLLGKQFPGAQLTECDLSFDMIQISKTKNKRPFHICSIAEKLPIKTGCFDLVFSNLMLQWTDQLDVVCTEVSRVLRPGGLFMFSTLGPDTLQELRNCWAMVDDKPHVSQFTDMHLIGDALIRTGFVSPVLDIEHFTLLFKNVHQLMRELRQLGGYNLLKNRRKTLTGKNRLMEMVEHYNVLKQDNRIPASYEIIYGHAWRREPITNPDPDQDHTAVIQFT